LVEALRDAKADCKVVLPWGAEIRLCETQPRGADGSRSTPRFGLELKNERPLREPLTQLSLGSAYVRGDLDIAVHGRDAKTRAHNIMSVFEVRDALRSGTSMGQALRLAGELALSRPTDVNARAIEHHYSLGDDFYHTFLDDKYHLYS